MLAYGFSGFLIDMGSSLGLWFGLSVFGITDLGVVILGTFSDTDKYILSKTINMNKGEVC